MTEMTRRIQRLSLQWSITTIALLAGCAATQNTLAQDLAYERWAKCEGQYPTVKLKRVEADGRIWFLYNAPSDLAGAHECLRKASVDQASASRPASGNRAASVAPAPALPVASTIGSSAPIPTWRPGDEWGFRWESSQGKGTFVWSMDREEVVEGVRFYVIKSGNSREIYFRKSDFAYYMDRVDGRVETRHTPPTAWVPWPPTPGAKWELRYTRERPLDRQTEEMVVGCESGPEELVTVPAGTFETMKIVCRNTRTGAVIYEIWPSLAARQWVRERAYFSYGVRERELIGIKLR